MRGKYKKRGDRGENPRKRPAPESFRQKGLNYFRISEKRSGAARRMTNGDAPTVHPPPPDPKDVLLSYLKHSSIARIRSSLEYMDILLSHFESKILSAPKTMRLSQNDDMNASVISMSMFSCTLRTISFRSLSPRANALATRSRCPVCSSRPNWECCCFYFATNRRIMR